MGENRCKDLVRKEEIGRRGQIIKYDMFSVCSSLLHNFEQPYLKK